MRKPQSVGGSLAIGRTLLGALAGLCLVLPAGARAKATSSPAPTPLEALCGSCRLELYSTCDGLLEGPGFDRNGVLWVMAPAQGRILKVDPSGKCGPGITMPMDGALPDGMRFLPDGHMLGVDAGRGLFNADPKTGTVTYLAHRLVTGGYPGAIFHGLDDLAIDAAGGAYITDALGSSALNPVGGLYYRAADGQFTKLFSGRLAFPDGVVLSPDEHTLYVSEYDGGDILQIPVVGPGKIDIDRAAVFVHTPGGVGPDGMAVDVQGNLYVADWGGGGRVDIYDPDGSYDGAIRLEDGVKFSPTNLTFHDGWLYVVDAKGKVWRVRMKVEGMKLYGDR